MANKLIVYGAAADWADGDILYALDLVTAHENASDQFIADAELAVRILQANNVFTNGPNMVADEATDSNGTNNTVNTGTSTAYYESVNDKYILNNGSDLASAGTTHNPESFASSSNAFDGDDSTAATKTVSNGAKANLGKTFSSQYVGFVKVVSQFSYVSDSTSDTVSIKLQTYNGSTWSTVSTLASTTGGSSIAKRTDEIFLDSTVQGIRVRFDANDDDLGFQDYTASLYTLEYYQYESSSTVVCDQNSTTLDGNEKGFAISVPDSTFPANTSMTVTVSDGTNSLTAQAIDEIAKGIVIGNSSANGGPLSSGTLKLTFNLSNTDTSATPTLPSYGCKILR